MRARILSSVLLPAPLRPTMPTASPRATSKRHVAQRPELVRRPRAAQRAQQARERSLLAQAVALAEALDADRDVLDPSRHTWSAKTALEPAKDDQAAREQEQGRERGAREQAASAAAALPSRAQRKPSTTPAIGFSA